MTSVDITSKMTTTVNNGKRLAFNEKKRILRQLDETDGYITSKCLAPKEPMGTPLLDTINTLTSWSDSSDECDITHMSPKSSTHQFCPRAQSKSVRFNSSVKFSSVPNSIGPEVPTKTTPKPEMSPNYVSNKSILKDPLCETLRSAIKAGEFTTSCSLEGEIDELLYGRLNPRPPLVTTRPPKLSPYGICGTPTTPPNPAHNSHIYGTYGKTNRRSSKSQFQSMSKCMFGILEDIHPLPSQPSLTHSDLTYKHLGSVRRQNSLITTRDDDTESIDILMKELSNGQSDTSDLSDISSISYRTLPEQHIYEEILYDCLESQQKDRKHHSNHSNHCSKYSKH